MTFADCVVKSESKIQIRKQFTTTSWLNEKKDNVEIVHWYYTNDIGIGKIKRQTEREGGRILILPSPAEEKAGGLSGRTNGLSSDREVTKDSENNNTSLAKSIETARQETKAAPIEAQAASGNYKKGHIKIDGYDISLEPERFHT